MECKLWCIPLLLLMTVFQGEGLDEESSFWIRSTNAVPSYKAFQDDPAHGRSLQQIDVSDMKRLLGTLKRAITSDPSGLLNSWDVGSSTADPCKDEWIGIICGPSDANGVRQITTIDLSNRSLRGGLSPSVNFTSFSSLTVLDLSDNNLTLSSQVSDLSFLVPSSLRLLNLSYNPLTGGSGPTFSNLFNLASTALEQVWMDKTGLTGTLPEQLAQLNLGRRLPALTTLSLSQNSFIGELPNAAAQLVLTTLRLQHIDLSHNNLSGTLEGWCSGGDAGNSNLSSALIYLDLSNNKLQGKISPSLANCTALQHLDLSYNSLHAELPPDLALSCRNLSFLSVIYANTLSGPIPPQFGLLSRLESLLLEGNDFSGEPLPILLNCSALRTIHFFGNSFHGRIPEDFGARLPSLQDLVLGNNSFSGLLPQSMGNCSFTNLMLGFNDFSGNIPGDVLGKWGHSITRQIDLQFNNFSGAIPPQIGNLTKLSILILNNNHLSGSFPKEIGLLSSLTGATFEHNLLSGNFPPQIFNCTKLLHLIIHDNNLGGPLPSTIGQTADLAYLEAQNNLLSGILPDALSNCTQLQNFSLAGNQLTGTIPDYLAASPSTLFLFDLSRNNFSGAISSSFGNKVQMQQLDLSHNKLTGSIPSELSLCLGLISMNLAFNSLRGEIPSSFGKSLESLTTLDLSFNSLSGGIPSELGSMRSLKYLDISSNNLTGSIPSTFLTAPSLQYINLSYNDLEGTIPDDRSSVFGNATAAWFLGNPRLCGEIIHRECPSSHRSVLKSKAAKVVYISVPILVLLILNLILLAVFLKRRKLQEARNLDVKLKFMKLQLREIEEATNNFSNDNLIGCGAFGSVYKGVTKDGKVLAFKKFTLDSSSIHSFFRELEIVRQIRHRSLVKALGYWSNHLENNVLVLEYMELGSLDAHLHHMGKPRSCKLSLQERWNVSSTIVDGLLYLHYECPNAPIVHCDIKPSNILFDSHMQPRISDFGLSRVLVDMVTSTQNLQGTLGYMAPECASSGRISPKCDVYSFGIIVIEMMTGVGPHDREILGENVTLLEWVRSKVSVGLYDEVLDGTMLAEYKKTLEIAEQIELLLNVALECTKDNPKDRPNIKEVHFRLEKSSMFSMKAPFSGHNETDSSKFSDSSIPDSWS